MDLVKVGRLNKSFGTSGQIKVMAKDKFIDDLLEANVWFVDKAGDMIPFFVETTEVGSNFLVKFEDITSPETAKQITGSPLFLRARDVSVSEEKPPIEKLIGFELYNGKKYVGKIDEIEEYPQQIMASISVNGDMKLIPLHDSFIVDIDPSKRKLIMELPEGILDL